MSTDLWTAARQGFTTAFGYAPHATWSAPGRVNLIGEHTDYNEGFALPMAIDRRTVAALALRDDQKIRVSSGQGGGVVEPALPTLVDAGTAAGTAASASTDTADTADTAAAAGGPDSWAAYPFGVTWGLGQLGAKLATLPGFDVHFVSDVPVGAGLSSSAAIESALAVALNEMWRLCFSGAQLVQAAHLAENDFVGAPTGILDQSASLLAQDGAALFLDCRDGATATVDLGLDAGELTIAVIDTKVKHAHVSGGYAARRASCEKAAQALGVRALRDVTSAQLEAARGLLDDETFRRARHIVTEDQRVLDAVAALRAGGPTAQATFGELMTASHNSMRDDFEISTVELDLAVDISLKTGALGARMTGGGFGGSVIALLPQVRVAELRTATAAAFAAHDYPVPETFAVRPSQGARRDE